MTATLQEPFIEPVNYDPSKETQYSEYIDNIIQKQRAFYQTGATRYYDFRKQQLQKLLEIIVSNEEEIGNAIKKDMKRSDAIISFTIGIMITEIKFALEPVLTIKPPFITRRLAKWMAPKRKRSSAMFLGSKVYTKQVSKGVVLIIGPWNYPFLLLIAPLVGSIAAGNCSVIKPSEKAPHTSEIFARLINENFNQEYLYVIEGGVEESKILIDKSWDHLFFTGGTEIGREVYQTAAKNLVPVTLELGGKTPTIIDQDVHLELAAKRIAQMKFANAGQTCMAPDYLLVHENVKSEFIDKMQYYLRKFYSEDPSSSDEYARVINKQAFDRLASLMKNDSKILSGGETVATDKYIAPTLIDEVTWNDEIMQEEVFGPILPLISWSNLDEVITHIESRPHPLALYVYTKNKTTKNKIIDSTHFGAAMVNDSVLYYLHPDIPFGGIGNSGMGNYTGKYSFDTFTQNRPVIEMGGFVDRFSETIGLKFFRYPPSSNLKLKLLEIFQRGLSRFRF